MKAGLSESTRYRVLSRKGAKWNEKPQTRRRLDPLAGVFDAKIVQLFESAPEIRAVSVYQKQMDEHSDLLPGIHRTLERKIRDWKAENGPCREARCSAKPRVPSARANPAPIT